jgi:hypothetical protein
MIDGLLFIAQKLKKWYIAYKNIKISDKSRAIPKVQWHPIYWQIIRFNL